MTVDGADTVTLTAAVTNDKTSAGVSWAITSGGGTLSNQTTTSAKYTAPAATSSQQSVTITATSVAKSTQTGTITITVPAMPAVTSTSANLTGAVGTAFSVKLTASGGIPPFTWALGSGTTLPTCLTLKPDGTLTTTTGTAPTTACAGSYTNLTFKATDSGTPSPLSVTSSPLTITIAAAPAITFTGAVPGTGTYGVAFSGSAAATGGAGALTYSISAGALPTDLSLNTSTGAITGTPNKAADVGTFHFTVQAADAYGDSNTQAYTLVIGYSAVNVTAATLPTGYAGSAYTATTLAAKGGNGGPYTWTWAAASGSSVPAGLSLSTGGAITGTPTTAGTYMVVATATDSALNSGNATFTIQVKAGVSITTSTTLPAGYANSSYSQPLAAMGGSGTGYTWSTDSAGTASLTAVNLTLSSGGTVSGAPTSAGTATFTAKVTDSVGNSASATFTLTVKAGVSVTPPASLPNGYPGAAYTPSGPFTASGGSGTGYTFTWAAASGSTLPNGLSISSAGAVSGTPTNAGTSSVTSSVIVTATDSLGNKGSATVSITIEASLVVTTSATLPAGTVAVAYSQVLAASGGSGTGFTWSTDSAGTTSLAGVGLTLAANGTIAGASPTLGTATFTATVKDSENHTATLALSVSINNLLKINETTLPAGDAGSSYSQTLTASGGSGSGFTFTATNSNLSTFGLTLASSGSITGTPSQAGTVSFTANVKDSANATATQALTITINSALTLPTPNPSSLPSGYTGVLYSGSIAASGGSGTYCYSVVSGLPSDGLSAPANNSLCGYTAPTFLVSGTPTSAATITFTLKVTDGTGASVTKIYTITVTTPTPVALPAANPSSLPAATINQAYTGAITATGGVPPYTWSINGAAVGSGGLSLGNGTLSASSSGGSSLSVTGTPSSTGTVNLTSVKVVDSANTNATQSYTITVNSAGQTVSGGISLINVCGAVPPLPTITVTLKDSGGNVVQTTSTTTTGSGGFGNYSFTNVPNGTYTVNPSISGPASMFVPATRSVTVNSASVSVPTISVSLGYTVAGTVSYAGSKTGVVYVNLLSSSCSASAPGTSVTLSSGSASYTIRGVPPGSYTLQSWMDLSTLNEGIPNTSDPNGSTSGVTVTSSSLTGQAVTLNDPTVSVGTNAPRIKDVAPQDSGAVISFGAGPFYSSNGFENYTSYTVQWSTSSTSGFSSSNQAVFKAIGRSANVWILRNGNANMTGTLTNGTAYYFKVWGSNAAGNSPVTTTTTAVTIGAPNTGFTVSGTIYIPSNVTIKAGAVLYAGLYDGNSNTAYADVIATPVNTSGGNNFTVHVPAGTNYTLFGILDQNKDGLIDAGDDTNVNNSNTPLLSVSGNLSGQNVTLPSANSLSQVQTNFTQFTSASGTSTVYGLNFVIGAGNKLPVAVTLTGGAHVITPVDIGNACESCGKLQYQYFLSIGSALPSVGDSYTFTVTYSDGTSDTGVIAVVSGWNGGTSVPGVADLVTNMLPNGTTGPSAGTRTQPTFTWTVPSSESSDIFTLQVYDFNGGGLLWYVPGTNSGLSGFPSSLTSIAWGVDPTDSSNLPSVTSLTTAKTYYWVIIGEDSSGNRVQTWTYYIP